MFADGFKAQNTEREREKKQKKRPKKKQFQFAALKQKIKHYKKPMGK